MGGIYSMHGGLGGAYKDFVGKPEKRDHQGGVAIDRRIILKWILKEQDVRRIWTGFIWLRMGSSNGLL
jgi:hypothetical protein